MTTTSKDAFLRAALEEDGAFCAAGRTSRRKTSSQYSMYPRVKATAFHMLRLAEDNETGSLYTAFASVVFSAFQYEAALNEVGIRLFPGWDTQKANLRRREEKEQALCKQFGVWNDPVSVQGILISRAIMIRDSFAHPKPAIDSAPEISDSTEMTFSRMMMLPPKVVRHQDDATPEFARKVFDAVTAFASQLFTASGVDEAALSMSFECSTIDDVVSGST